MFLVRLILLIASVVIVTACQAILPSAIPTSSAATSFSSTVASPVQPSSTVSVTQSGKLSHYRGPNPYRNTPEFEIEYDAAIWQFVEDDGSGRRAQLFQRSLPGCSLWLQAGPVGDRLLDVRLLAGREWTISLVQPTILDYLTPWADIYFIFGVILPEKYAEKSAGLCQQAAEAVLQTFKVVEPSSTALPLPTRTATRRSKLTSTPTDTPPTKTPTITLTSVPVVAAPPGLIYSDDKGQWRIAVAGKPALIISDTDALVSPNRQMAIVHSECCSCGCDRKDQLVNLIDGNTRLLGSDLWYGEWSQDSQHFYYVATGENDLSDIWVEDAITGEKRNLSQTPDRHEGQLFIWPNQTDYLFFYSWPIDVVADGEGWHGYPTIMKTDGTEYQVISNDLGTGLIALSPDGVRLPILIGNMLGIIVAVKKRNFFRGKTLD